VIFFVVAGHLLLVLSYCSAAIVAAWYFHIATGFFGSALAIHAHGGDHILVYEYAAGHPLFLHFFGLEAINKMLAVGDKGVAVKVHRTWNRKVAEQSSATTARMAIAIMQRLSKIRFACCFSISSLSGSVGRFFILCVLNFAEMFEQRAVPDNHSASIKFAREATAAPQRAVVVVFFHDL